MNIICKLFTYVWILLWSFRFNVGVIICVVYYLYFIKSFVFFFFFLSVYNYWILFLIVILIDYINDNKSARSRRPVVSRTIPGSCWFMGLSISSELGNSPGWGLMLMFMDAWAFPSVHTTVDTRDNIVKYRKMVEFLK